MTECSGLAPLRRDGTSQRERQPPALDTRSIEVDERGTLDLLRYVSKLAARLRYYNPANQPDGDWTPFLEADPSALAAAVADDDVLPHRLEFDRAQRAARAADATTFPSALAPVFPPVFDLAQRIEEWRRASVAGLSLRAGVERLIEGALADALQDAVGVLEQARHLGATALPLFDATSFGPPWGPPQASRDRGLFASGGFAVAGERSHALDVVARAFDRLYESARRIVADAPAFFADSLVHHPAHAPQAALLLTFLKLMGRARAGMNRLTDRHLDFHYRELLALQPRPPAGDCVHVVFELAKARESFPVPAGTALNAGADATGVPVVFETRDEIVVNRGALDPEHGLKTVYVEADTTTTPRQVRNIYAAPDADSADGLGAPLQGAERRWPTFGNTRMPYARIGFALASPMFRLAEGSRTIQVRFDLTSAAGVLAGQPEEDVERELIGNVRVQGTGPKGWVDLRTRSVNLVTTGTTPYVEYFLDLAPDAPALVGFDATIHGEPFQTKHPVLRFVLDNRGLPARLLPVTYRDSTPGYPSGTVVRYEGDLYRARVAVPGPDFTPYHHADKWERVDGPFPSILDYSDETESYAAGALVRFEDKVYRARLAISAAGFRPPLHADRWEPVEHAYPYRYFEGMAIRAIQLTVRVAGARNVLVESDAGPLSPAKPFAPFGPAPRTGSTFLIGYPEAFEKRLTRIEISLRWSSFPDWSAYSDQSLAGHYAQYKTTGGATIVNANSYFTAAAHVLDDDWKALASPLTLFNTPSGATAPAVDRTFSWSFNNAGHPSLPRRPPKAAPKRFQSGLGRGFLRLTLNKSFLHELFPKALAQYSGELARGVTTTPPNPPYTPTISQISLGYTAEETIDYTAWTRAHAEARLEQLFHIAPFGHQEVLPLPAATAPPPVLASDTLVPIFPAEGTLYLGVIRLKPPQNLSFLFQMAEGSEDPELRPQKVRWSHLTGTGWVDFGPTELLADSTSGLIRSGIVQLAVPRTVAGQTTLLPAGRHWIRAVVERDSRAVPDAIAVFPQAVRACFRDAGNDPARLAFPLPKETIAKLVVGQAAIKSVAQPYASFGARMRESAGAFRVRVAERLRHKGRAITLFDYERLVLARFKEVYKVRCLTHTDDASEYAPGHVRVVVVPDLRNKNAVDPLRPRLSLGRLEEIRDYLLELASGFVDIRVVNPDYEEVRVRFDVRFHPGRDEQYYKRQLEQDVIRFLSPWLYDEAVDLTFGGRVHRSSILNFVDEREYVDFVVDFEMDHTFTRAGHVAPETRLDVEEAATTRSSAVLVSAATHEVRSDVVSCEDDHPAPLRRPPASPAAAAPSPGAPPYVADADTLEVHDRRHVETDCQAAALLAAENPIYFLRSEDAAAHGYDFCAFCFGRALARR